MLFRILPLCLALFIAGCQTDGGSPLSPQLAAAQSAPRDARYAGIVVDADTSEVLYSENADATRYPASLTKMMTMYILFEEMEAGRFSPNSELAVSAAAARQPATKIGLRAGSTISVEQAMQAICVHSANDVALAVAENISGSEHAFAERMTLTAHRLGMNRTIFRNSTGLPDPDATTTARDMATLALAVRQRFPDRARLFAAQSFEWNGHTYKATNELLGAVPGVDGMKTGYTRASGYNLAASVQRGGRRLIVVVMGEPTNDVRNARVAELIDQYAPEHSSWLALR